VRGDYEFTILYDLYEEKEVEGQSEYILKKKDCRRRWYVSDVRYISDIREIPNKDGRIYKTKCEIFHSPESKWITVKGKFEELKNILKVDRKEVKGFYGSK